MSAHSFFQSTPIDISLGLLGISDEDEDGIMDSIDNCPDTTLYAPVCSDGCIYEKCDAVDDQESPVCQDLVVNNNDPYSYSELVTLSLQASDNVGVRSFYASEDDILPQSNALGWVQIPLNTTVNDDFPFAMSSASGLKTLHVWIKDEGGNISNSTFPAKSC